MTAVQERVGHGRRPELDGLRGVAILLVVFGHATAGVWPSYRGLAPSLGSLGGLAGVQLFFVLSGYLITGVLLRGPSLLDFYRRRVRRLYPTLIVVTLAALVWTGDAAGALRALTYTENVTVLPAGGTALSHTWSLAVEEQFYLAWPALLLLTRKHAAKVCGALILATWVAQHYAGWSEHAVYVGLRWDAVLAGCLLALAPRKASKRWLAAGGAVLAAITLGLDLGVWQYMVATLAAVAVVASAGSVRWLRTRWLVHVGHISYALYLWHVLVMRLDAPILITLPLALVLAEFTYRFVDRQAQSSHPEPLEARPTPCAAVPADEADLVRC